MDVISISLSLPRYLWTGESEYCICGHHVTDHETLQWPILLTEPPIVICGGGDKSRIIHNCECGEFRPYRVGVEDEVEKQNWEVIKE